MSKETREWLSQNTLIGFTDKRGNAWHYREGDDNHFPGAVPVETVRQRLFAWNALKVPEQWTVGGKRYQSDTDFVVCRSDTGAKLGTFKDGYQPHQYGEWLIDNVSNILDSDVQIGSAVLLKGGAVACVSVEIPDSITTPEGVVFRPHLLAATSFDGTVATTYKRVITNVVCDNTMSAALREKTDQEVKVRHSRKSLDRLADARETLGIIYEVADEFQAEVKALCEQEVSDKVWDKVLDILAPLPSDGGYNEDGSRTRALSLAENKRDVLATMWNSDERVTPWRNTAYGVWQMVNTYQHHEGHVRGMGRPERNMLRAIDGSTFDADRQVMKAVLAAV